MVNCGLPSRSWRTEKRRKQVSHDRQDDEEEDRAGEEELQIQISALRIEERIGSARNVHPAVKMISAKPDRQKENTQNRKKQGDILELPPNDHGPLRVDDVMHDGPEETADAESEEKDEGEEPGKTELHRR